MSDLQLRVQIAAIDKITAPLRGIAKQSQRLSQGYKADMGSYNATLKQTEKALAGVRETQRKMIAAGNHNTSASIKAEQALMKRIEETNAAIQRRKELMDQEMAVIRRRQAAMDRGKEQMMRGVKMTGVATAATYAGARFMMPGFDFDEQMSKVQSLTRMNANDPMLAKLREQAKELGATTWASATQAADAQAFYAMSGFDPQAILDALPATLDLAKAGGVEVGRAADIGSNILSAFGLEPTEMNKVADILVSVFTRTNTSLEMLGETMKYVGPVAKELKIPLEEATAMAGILGNVGIQGSQAGTAMRALQSRLAAPPSGAKKSLEELKVNTKDALGNFRAMPEILADVMKATEKMGNAERLGHLKAIAGEEAGAAFAAFLDANNYQDLLKVIDAAYNAQSSFADELTASFNNLSDAGKEALKSLNIDLLDDNKELKEIPKILNEIVEASKNLDQADQIDLMQKIGGNKLSEAFMSALDDINRAHLVTSIDAVLNIEDSKITEIQQQLKALPESTQEALDSLEIDLYDDNKNLREITEIVADILEAKNIDRNKQINLIQNILGENLSDSLLIKLDEKSINNEELLEAVKKHYKIEGEASRVAGVMSNNVKGDWTGLLSAIESVQINVSELETGGIRSLIQSMSEMVRKMSDWIKENPKLAGTLFKVTAGIIAIVAGLGSLSMAMAIFNMTVLANPIVLVIGAIIAAVVALVYYKDEIWNFFKSFFSAPGVYIKKAISYMNNLIDTVSNLLGKIPVIGPLAKGTFELMMSPLRIIYFLIGKIVDAFTWISNTWVTPKIDTSGFENSFDVARGVVDFILDIRNSISNLIGEIPVIGPVLQFIFDMMTVTFAVIMQIIKKVIGAFEWIGDNWGTIAGWFGSMWDSIVSAAQPVIDIFKWILELINDVIIAIKEAFSFEAPQWMQDTGSFLGNTYDYFADSLSYTAGLVGEQFDNVFGRNSKQEAPTAALAVMPAIPVRNIATTNHQEVHVEVHATTNASPQVIGGAIAQAIKSKAFIGDEY